MSVIFQTGYTLPGGDQPLTHARIAHSLNWRSGGTAVASTTATGYFANAPLNTLTYEKWKPTGATGTWEYNHGSSVSCNYCCIGGHTLGTSGSTIQIEYWNGSAWVAVSPSTAVTDNSAIMAIFIAVSAQRWRVNITAGTSAPEIAVIKFGTALQLERPIFGGHAPILFARQTVMKMNESETGEYLGRSKWRTYLETTYSWQNLTASWVGTNWPSLQRAVETEPFFIAWRPSGYPDQVAFGRAMGVPIPSNSGTRDLMAVELQMRALSYD
jgi:hypothetical protein